MAARGCISTRPHVPWTAVGPRPLEHVEMAALGCIRTRPLVPGTAVGARPLEHVEMAAFGCMRTRPHVPGAAKPWTHRHEAFPNCQQQPTLTCRSQPASPARSLCANALGDAVKMTSRRRAPMVRTTETERAAGMVVLVVLCGVWLEQ
jgi:hypothetical protein